jgi:thiol-disulfide isomerase/thioredoxin
MLLRVLIGGAIGLLAGAAAGSFLKARGGTCPLTCNPIGGAMFGALLGAVLAGSFGQSGGAGKMLDGVPGVTSAAELDAMIAGPRPVLADFYTDNCGFCAQLAPTISALAQQYKGRADVVKVNASAVAELSRRYDIQGVPTVLLFSGGKEPAQRWVGVQEVGKYQAALDAAIGPADKQRKTS